MKCIFVVSMLLTTPALAQQSSAGMRAWSIVSTQCMAMTQNATTIALEAQDKITDLQNKLEETTKQLDKLKVAAPPSKAEDATPEIKKE